MRFFNVIFYTGARPLAITGADDTLAKDTAAKLSAMIERGEKVTLVSIPRASDLLQIDCVG